MKTSSLLTFLLPYTVVLALPQSGLQDKDYFVDFNAPSRGRADRDAFLQPYLDRNPYGHGAVAKGLPEGFRKTMNKPQAEGVDVLFGEEKKEPAAPESEPVPEAKEEIGQLPPPSEMAFGPEGKEAQIDAAKGEHIPSPEEKEKNEGEESEDEDQAAEEKEVEDKIQHHVNQGGVQKGSGGDGPTNFHVYSDENGEKRYSDQLDPESEAYIRDKMIPKLQNAGKRKKKGGENVWDVFGP